MVKRARIKDIASIAGVSIGTVDRVLHNRGEVAEDTRSKVLQIAKELEYSPNLMARALKTKQNYKLVILLPLASPETSFWYKHYQGFEKVKKEIAPFQVSLEYVSFDIQNEVDFRIKTAKVISMSPDGVVFAPIFKKESMLFCNELHKLQLPYLFIDSYIDDSGALSYIGEDAYQSGRIAAQLIDYGTNASKDILIVNVAKDLDNRLHLGNRTQGFLSYFMDVGHNSGLKISIEIQQLDYESIKITLDKVVQGNPNIGAVFITSSKAYIIARYFEDTKNRNVNIVGYDIVDKNTKYLRTGYIRFLLGQRPAEQVEIAVRKLYDYLALGKVPNQKEYLPVDVVTPENITYFT
ncbi:MAG: substrate-binding domain-containing protein [Marinilabiliaceae bacterium]|nr:substrate-binding domain-containing protein [Marinilabiliaceae bacterium]